MNTDAVFLSLLFTRCLAEAIWLCSQALFIFTRHLFTRSLIDVLQSPNLSGLSVTSRSAPRCIIKNVDRQKGCLFGPLSLWKSQLHGFSTFPLVSYFRGIKTLSLLTEPSNAINRRPRKKKTRKTLPLPVNVSWKNCLKSVIRFSSCRNIYHVESVMLIGSA